MAICTISDLHIKTPGDSGHLLLKKFLDHPQVRSSKHIALLGDIFDLWVGDISHKYESFKDVFDSLDILAREGKKVYYFEGNHDLHLKNLETKVQNIQYVRDYIVLNIESKAILLSHGDWFDLDDRVYYHYRRFIGSRGVAKVVLGVMGEKLINNIGEMASKMSRSRNNQKYSFEASDEVREKFRSLAYQAARKYKVDIVVWGHSHVKDIYTLDGMTYINNGYAPFDKTFNYISAQGEPAQIILV